MAERSFAEEVKKLRAGAGDIFEGEGILAITKALVMAKIPSPSKISPAPARSFFTSSANERSAIPSFPAYLAVNTMLSLRQALTQLLGKGSRSHFLF